MYAAACVAISSSSVGMACSTMVASFLYAPFFGMWGHNFAVWHVFFAFEVRKCTTTHALYVLQIQQGTALFQQFVAAQKAHCIADLHSREMAMQVMVYIRCLLHYCLVACSLRTSSSALACSDV